MWESRVAPLAGLGFAVLIVASALIGGNYDFMPPAEEVATYYTGDSARIMVSVYVGLLAAIALLWFSGSLYAHLRRSDGPERLPLLALGGGVLAAGMITVGYLANMAGAERAQLRGSIDPGVAASLFDLAGLVVGSGAAFGLAVMIGASAIVSIRSDQPSRGIAWISGLLALGLISPFGWAVMALAVVWVGVAGVWIYRAELSAVVEPATTGI